MEYKQSIFSINLELEILGIIARNVKCKQNKQKTFSVNKGDYKLHFHIFVPYKTARPLDVRAEIS